jgi:hypothetical protein
MLYAKNSGINHGGSIKELMPQYSKFNSMSAIEINIFTKLVMVLLLNFAISTGISTVW